MSRAISYFSSGSPSQPARKQTTSQTTLLNFAVLALAVLVPILRSPALHHPLKEPYTHPNYPLRILSSVQSTTGIIVVGEALPPILGGDETAIHSVRYLRAAHSLLGGVWVGEKIATMDNALPLVDEEGTPLGDSIYTAFVLQEAVRLVDSTEIGKAGKWENALVM